MKIKAFDDYVSAYSKDPRNFEKKVTFASTKQTVPEVFEKISSPFDFKNSAAGNPVILWDGFSFDFTQVNEKSHFFNKKVVPSSLELFNKYKTKSFVPKSTKDRLEVKGLKFPIVGEFENDSEEFKTYGKFKKSEKSFSSFREKPIPRTKFDVLAFKGEPIHVEERINKLGFDVNLNSFEFLNEINEITGLINQDYSPDFYKVRLLESDGKIYLDSIFSSGELSPSQYLKMYESAYENAYHAKLPNWFKNSLFEKHVRPFYKRRGYDALLIKPKHSIDFKKYLES